MNDSSKCVNIKLEANMNRMKLFAGIAVALCAGAGSLRGQLTFTTGLQLRLDAGAGVTTSGGGFVDSWADQSGNGNHVTGSGSTRPVLVASGMNGQPAIQFDGVDDLLNNTTANLVSSGSARTVFVAAESTPGANLANGALFTFRRSGPLMTLEQLDHPSAWFIYSDGVCCNQNTPALPFVTNAFVAAYTSTGPGNLLQFRLNGLGPPTITVSGQNVVAETGTTGFTVGNREDFPTIQVWRGNIAEVLVYDAALGNSDRQSVEEYLFAKYSIPEPSALAPLGVGALVLWRRRGVR